MSNIENESEVDLLTRTACTAYKILEKHNLLDELPKLQPYMAWWEDHKQWDVECLLNAQKKLYFSRQRRNCTC